MLRIRIDPSLPWPYAAIKRATFENLSNSNEWATTMEGNRVLVGDVSSPKFFLRLEDDEKLKPDVLYVSEGVKQRWYSNRKIIGNRLGQRAPRKPKDKSRLW